MKIALNTLAILLGLVLGSAVNMAIVITGGLIVPPPPDSDTTTMEGLKVSMHLFTPKHFVFPFLAHSLGTFIGALVAFFVARSHKTKIAYAIGVLFLGGGFINVLMLPSPLWYNLIDLLLAYIPMSWLATELCLKFNSSSDE